MKPLLIIMLFLTMSGCARLTMEEQNKLGEDISANIAKSVTLVTNAEVDQYINNLADQLIVLAPETEHEFTFHLIQSDGFNAFAVAGGNIYLTTGLIKNCRNVSELVSIMGHEVAHIKLGHIEESYRPNRVSKTIADFAGITLAIATANPFLMGAGTLVTGLGSSIYITNHSRGSEREADELAFQMMLETGYDVRSQLTIFARLEIASDALKGRKKQLPFLTTHPMPDARVEAVKQRLELLDSYRPDIISDQGQLEIIQSILR